MVLRFSLHFLERGVRGEREIWRNMEKISKVRATSFEIVEIARNNGEFVGGRWPLNISRIWPRSRR